MGPILEDEQLRLYLFELYLATGHLTKHLPSCAKHWYAGIPEIQGVLKA